MIDETILAAVGSGAAALAVGIDRGIRRLNGRKAGRTRETGDGNSPLVLHRLNTLDKATGLMAGNMAKLTERVVRIETQTEGLGSAIKDGFHRVETELICVKNLAAGKQPGGRVQT